MGQVNKTRKLTEGALSTALFLVFLLVSGYVPVISLLSVWFLPIPIIYYISKWGLQPALLVLGSALTLSFILAGPLLGFLAFYFLTLGIAAGWSIDKYKTMTQVWTVTAVASAVVMVCYYIVSVWLFNVDFITSAIKQMKAAFQTAGQLSASWGAGSEKIYEELIKEMENLVVLTPMILILSGAFAALVLLLIATPVLKKLGVSVPSWPPFREWRMPQVIIFVFAIVLAYLLFFQPKSGEMGYKIALNTFYTVVILLQIQGFSLIFYFAYVKRLGKGLPILAVFSGFIFQTALYIIVLLGIIDLGYGLRKRMK